MLSFKKLRLFAFVIKTLNIKHYIEEHIHILNNRIIKIAAFSILADQSNIRAFLNVVDII